MKPPPWTITPEEFKSFIDRVQEAGFDSRIPHLEGENDWDLITPRAHGARSLMRKDPQGFSKELSKMLLGAWHLIKDQRLALERERKLHKDQVDALNLDIDALDRALSCSQASDPGTSTEPTGGCHQPEATSSSRVT